jgi:hypothetical protein
MCLSIERHWSNPRCVRQTFCYSTVPQLGGGMKIPLCAVVPNSLRQAVPCNLELSTCKLRHEVDQIELYYMMPN